MSEPARVPTHEQIDNLLKTGQAFIDRSNLLSGSQRVQEDEFLPLAVNLADAIHPIRPIVDADEDWESDVTEPLSIIIKHFDATMKEWGWEWIAQPETERSDHIERQRKRFRNKIELRLCDATLSWWKGRKALDFDARYKRYVQQGRSLGISPTMPPEEGKTLAISLHQRFYQDLIFGTANPEFSPEHINGLRKGIGDLYSALDMKPPQPQQTRPPINPLAGEKTPADITPEAPPSPAPVAPSRQPDPSGTEAPPDPEPDSIDLAEMLRGDRPRARVQIEFLKYMKDRSSASYEELRNYVHDEPETSEAAIRQNMRRVNEYLDAKSVPRQFQCGSGYVTRVKDPE